MDQGFRERLSGATRLASKTWALIKAEWAKSGRNLHITNHLQTFWNGIEKYFPNFGRVTRFCWGVLKKYHRDDCFSYAAGLGFWLLISLVPLATLFFKLLVMILGRQAFYQQTLESLSNVIPFVPLNIMQDAVTRSREISDSMGFTWFVLLFGGYWCVSQLDKSLAHVFGVRINKKLQTRKYHLLRQFALLVGGLLLLAVVLALAVGGVVSKYLPVNQNVILTYLPMIICLVATTIIFQVIPRVHVAFRHAFIGALVTTFFWTVAKWGFRIYVDNVLTWGIMYGSLMSIIAGLTFLYYSCAILLLGAGVTAQLYRFKHSRRFNKT